MFNSRQGFRVAAVVSDLQRGKGTLEKPEYLCRDPSAGRGASFPARTSHSAKSESGERAVGHRIFHI